MRHTQLSFTILIIIGLAIGISAQEIPNPDETLSLSPLSELKDVNACRLNVTCADYDYQEAVCLMSVRNLNNISESFFQTGFLVKSHNYNFYSMRNVPSSTPPLFLLTSHDAFNRAGFTHLKTGQIFTTDHLLLYFDYEQLAWGGRMDPFMTDLVGENAIDSAVVLDASASGGYVLLLLIPSHDHNTEMQNRPRIEPYMGCLDIASHNYYSIHHGSQAPKHFSLFQPDHPPRFHNDILELIVYEGVIGQGASGGPILSQGQDLLAGLLLGSQTDDLHCPHDPPGQFMRGDVVLLESMLPHLWGWLMPPNWQHPRTVAALASQGIHSVDDYCIQPVQSPPELIINDPLDVNRLGREQNSISGWAADEDGIDRVVIQLNYWDETFVCQGQEVWHYDDLPISRKRETIMTITAIDNNGHSSTLERVIPEWNAVTLVDFSGHRVEPGHNHITWESASEVKNLGYYLYRNTENSFDTAQQIAFIPAQDMFGVYSYDDTSIDGRDSYYYWLCDVEDTGILGGPYGPVEILLQETNIWFATDGCPRIDVSIPGEQLGQSPHWGNIQVYNASTGRSLGTLDAYHISGYACGLYYYESREQGPGHQWPQGNYFRFHGTRAELRGQGLPRYIKIKLPGYSTLSNRLDLGAAIQGSPEIHIKRGRIDIPVGKRDAISGMKSRALYVTYTLYNQGTKDLKLTGSPRVTVKGQYARLERNPAPSVAPGKSTSFRLRLSAIRPGHSASISISIPNTDSDESLYSFTLVYSSFYRSIPIYPPIQPPYRIMTQEGVEVIDAGIAPEEFVLDQNHPNPFNPETTIRYQLDMPAEVSLAVYSIDGHQVRTLVNRHHPTGAYTVTWKGRDNSGRRVASGVYLYRLQAGERVLTRRMMMIK